MSSYGYREVEEDDGDATEEPDEAGGERDEVTAGRRHLLIPGRLHPLTPPVPVLLLGRRAASDGPEARAPVPATAAATCRAAAGERRRGWGRDEEDTRGTGCHGRRRHELGEASHILIPSILLRERRECREATAIRQSVSWRISSLFNSRWRLERAVLFFFFIPLVLCGRLVAKNRDRLFHIIIGLSLLL